jgi:hypothetical protein
LFQIHPTNYTTGELDGKLHTQRNIQQIPSRQF